MSKFVIGHSFERYEIVDANWFMCIGDKWLSFTSIQEAERFLGPFLNKSENISSLRSLLESTFGPRGSGLSPHDISQRVVELVVKGRLRIRPYDKTNDRWETSFGLPFGVWNETKQVKVASAEPVDIAEESPVQTSWVEIQFTDAFGNPLAGELAQIIDPEGLSQQLKTNANGIVHLKQVPEGNCDIEFPNLDGNSWIQE